MATAAWPTCCQPSCCRFAYQSWLPARSLALLLLDRRSCVEKQNEKDPSRTAPFKLKASLAAVASVARAGWSLSVDSVVWHQALDRRARGGEDVLPGETMWAPKLDEVCQ